MRAAWMPAEETPRVRAACLGNRPRGGRADARVTEATSRFVRSYSRPPGDPRLREEPMAERTAVITGGTGGLGATISTKLHDRGYIVVVTYSPSNTKIKETISEFKSKGYNFHAYEVDVADFDSCQACVERIHKEVGPVDILINNAGITRDMTFRKMGKLDWDAVVN